MGIRGMAKAGLRALAPPPPKTLLEEQDERNAAYRRRLRRGNDPDFQRRGMRGWQAEDRLGRE